MNDSKKRTGFTLLEMAIVFAIAGFVLVMAISFLKPYYADKVRLKNVATLQTVEDALSRYVTKQGKYPCPASPSAPRGSTNDGVANCAATGVISTAGARTAADRVVIGAVPYRELNISADSTVDGYFNRLTYAVSQKSTNDTTYSDDDTKPNELSGQIRILSTDDPANKTSLTRINGGAHYFVFSRGRNGAGAYTDSSALKSGNCPANEAENCNNDSTFVSARLALGSGNRYFDDVSKFNLPISYNNPSDKNSGSQTQSTPQTEQLWASWLGAPPSHSYPKNAFPSGEDRSGVRITDAQQNADKHLYAAYGVKIGQSGVQCNSASEGSLRYNKAIKKVEFCNGTKWLGFEQPCVGQLDYITTNSASINYSTASHSPVYDAANQMWGYKKEVDIDSTACFAKIEYSCGIKGQEGAMFTWINLKNAQNRVISSTYICSFVYSAGVQSDITKWNQPQLDRQFFRFGGTDNKNDMEELATRIDPVPFDAVKAEIFVSSQGMQSQQATRPADFNQITNKLSVSFIK